MNEFRGVFPIVNTTFHDDGTVDLDSQRRLVNYLIEAGAHGLGLFGTASEGYTLSGGERSELTAVILREAAGRVPVIVSSGHTGTDVAVSLSLEAERAGASALMVLPPYFLKPDADGVYEYFRQISDQVSIPIMVQDAPLISGVAIGAPLLAKMGKQLENVCLVKVEAPPTAPKISDVKKLDEADDLILFGGLNGHFLIEELQRGSLGTMPGSDLTEMFVRVWNSYQSGDVANARREFNRYLPIIRYELQPGLGVSAMKHNLKDAGIIASTRVRHPTKSLDETGARELAELRAELQIAAIAR